MRVRPQRFTQALARILAGAGRSKREQRARVGPYGETVRIVCVEKLFEIAVFEIVGAYSDLPLPVGLLFDGQGALSVVYLGEIEGAADDAARIQVGLGLPESRWPTALTGGRWVDQGPSRRLGALQDFLAKAGESALAAELAAEIERRGGN